MSELATERKRRPGAKIGLSVASLLLATACGGKTTVTETADNNAGIPAFSDNHGAALKHGEPARIPYGTQVEVACYAPNESGMSSINAFYKIVGGPWNNDYANAGSFNNGGPMGPTA